VAAAIVVAIYVSRFVILSLLGQREERRLLWIAPRGLITVLLFLTAVEHGKLGDFPFGTVMLVVLATASATALAQREPGGPPPQPATSVTPT
jgi:NADH:ubiquinone oxidoreductase subunit 3 (subunit A)